MVRSQLSPQKSQFASGRKPPLCDAHKVDTSVVHTAAYNSTKLIKKSQYIYPEIGFLSCTMHVRDDVKSQIEIVQ